MFITEQNTSMWTKMLKEEFNVQDTNKLNWVSEYAQVHSIYESKIGFGGAGAMRPADGVAPIYASPLNTIGMGNPAAPSNSAVDTTALGSFYKQTPGSGDIPVSTLPMALNVALTTIGLELLPVVPAKGPWVLLSYMDFPYAGGKINHGNLTSFDGVGTGAENKPMYFKVVDTTGKVAAEAKKLAVDAPVKLTTTGGTIEAKYKGIGRMDGNAFFEVLSCKDAHDDDVSLKEVLRNAVALTDTSLKVDAVKLDVDYVQTSVDFVPGFSNFATGSADPMTRAQNETGIGNTIGLRLFSKWVEMGSFEVTGTVTRQQLQDLPLYGVDAVSKVMEAMQNELTQSINHMILSQVFAMGVTNAKQQKARTGVDLNLWMGTTKSTVGAVSPVPMVDIYGVAVDPATVVENSEVNTSAENLATRQRRIMSRLLAASTLINTIGRRGNATWAVMSAKMAAALRDVSGYVVAPMVNTLTQDGQNLYHAGTVAGLRIYVDPYMDWNDTRICVGRKGTANEPGLIFSPYILAEQVSITAEGTMAPKMLVNSRFTIAPVGFYPELQYYTFCAGSEFDLI